jgi:diguanylate cyclase (GGDEF)-like protein
LTVERHLAERVRTAIADRAIASQRSPERIVTVSIGVVSLRPDTSHTAEHLIRLADTQMYEAKRAGRNRVKASPWPPPPERPADQ